jgi:hypothetical protein
VAYFNPYARGLNEAASLKLLEPPSQIPYLED